MPPAPGLADATLRQVVHVSLGGKRLRVRFSNAFGTKPLTILSAHLAASAGGSRDQARERQAAHVRRADFGDDPDRVRRWSRTQSTSTWPPSRTSR